MKVYVASSWRNLRQPGFVAALRGAGHSVYDFRHPTMGPGKRGGGFQWSEVDPNWQTWSPAQFRDALHNPIAVDGWKADLTGMRWADAIVLLMPCGRSAHLELGWAIGAGKLSIVLLEDSAEAELMYGLADYICLGTDEVIRVLGSA